MSTPHPQQPDAPAPAPVPRARHAARERNGQARAGSPIIAPGVQPAAVTVVLAGLVAVSAPWGQAALLPAVVVLQAVTAAGWFRLNGMWPARQGIALAFLAGLVASAVLVVVSGDRDTTVLLGVLGVFFLLVVVLQLRSTGMPADERMSALTATSAAMVLAVVAAGYLAAAGVSRTAVLVSAVAVAAAVLVRAVVRLPYVSVVVALGAAVGAGAAAGEFAGVLTEGALIGAAAGCCALVGLRVASYDFPSRFVHFTAGVALPLTAAAPAAYVLAHALL